jgi:hypothetical protein
VSDERRLQCRLLAQVEDDEKADFHKSTQQSAFSSQLKHSAAFTSSSRPLRLDRSLLTAKSAKKSKLKAEC